MSAKTRADVKKELDRLLEVKAEKRDGAIREMSEEALDKRIAELKAEVD